MDESHPIGRFEPPGTLDGNLRDLLIGQLAAAPERLRAAVSGLKAAQLDTAYREGGWTVRQVVHHLPDAHVNAYVRFKLALTEDEPAIRPFDQTRWGALPDAREGAVEPSLALLEALHVRWLACIRAMAPSDFARRIHHPQRGLMTLDDLLALYAWHGRHHVAQIMTLRERRGWT